jgi:hypothetical protein
MEGERLQIRQAGPGILIALEHELIRSRGNARPIEHAAWNAARCFAQKFERRAERNESQCSGLVAEPQGSLN